RTSSSSPARSRTRPSTPTASTSSTSAPPRATSAARRSCRAAPSSRFPRRMGPHRLRPAARERPMPELPEFLAAAEAWLEAGYPRVATEERGRFRWGEGSDEVRVFQEPDPVEEADALPRIRAWRAALWDAGYAWISGPKEYGGAGLPKSYEAAFNRLTRKFEVQGHAALAVSLGMIAPHNLRRR